MRRITASDVKNFLFNIKVDGKTGNVEEMKLLKEAPEKVKKVVPPEPERPIPEFKFHVTPKSARDSWDRYYIVVNGGDKPSVYIGGNGHGLNSLSMKSEDVPAVFEALLDLIEKCRKAEEL